MRLSLLILLIGYIGFQAYIISGYEELNTQLQDGIMRNLPLTDLKCGKNNNHK